MGFHSLNLEPRMPVTKSSDYSHNRPVQKCINAIEAADWEKFLHLVEPNPDILRMKLSRDKNGTFLHFVVGQPKTVPINVIVKLISLRPNLVKSVDDDLCTAIHTAASMEN